VGLSGRERYGPIDVAPGPHIRTNIAIAVALPDCLFESRSVCGPHLTATARDEPLGVDCEG
jgi:hypothetical protein